MKTPKVLTILTKDYPTIYSQLKKSILALEKINKVLMVYLEEKRCYFPRYQFKSNRIFKGGSIFQ
jgi:hypothetical protein